MEISMEFKEFPKMARWSREIVVTEKIDGANAQIFIGEDGTFLTGSRTRWITPDDDNFGFSKWAHENKEELLKLGHGRHFGEWWGAGIQRRYGQPEKRFSLFNTLRWCAHGDTPQIIPSADPRIQKVQDVLPECVGLVPVLYRGLLDDFDVKSEIASLATNGSVAAPGFMDPEGLVIFHVAAGVGFKKTVKKDDIPKAMLKAA